MNKEEMLQKIKDIHLLYTMPYRAENMRPEHYAIVEYEKLLYEQRAEIDNLQEENQKQKEVIDKAIEYVEKHLTDKGRFLMLNEWQVPDLLNILKEAEEIDTNVGEVE